MRINYGNNRYNQSFAHRLSTRLDQHLYTFAIITMSGNNSENSEEAARQDEEWNRRERELEDAWIRKMETLAAWEDQLQQIEQALERYAEILREQALPSETGCPFCQPK